MQKKNICLALLVAVFACYGCASVRVYKVDVDANGNETVNRHIEGIPYYVPRPWVEIYEPFVVDTEPSLVTAELTPDGKYLRLASVPTSSKDAAKLENLFIAVPPEGGAVTVSGDENDLQGMAGNIAKAKAKAGKAGSAATNAVAAAGNSGDTAKNPSSSPTNAPAAKTGVESEKVSSTSDFYITPGRRFFDIVYLPDYSDKRIIQVRGRLGKADMSVTLAQGWSLASLNAAVDNTELAKRLLETYDTGLELAKKVAATSLFPPAGALQGVAPASRNVTLVTCKLVDSTMVAPGLYPMPKDVEYPKAYGVRAPAVSFVQHLGLQTYHVYTVEALRPTGDSPLNFTQYPSVTDSPGTPPVVKGGNTPQPTPIDFGKVKEKISPNFQSGKYKDKIDDFDVLPGSSADKIKLSVKFKAALTDAEATAAKKELKTEAADALKDFTPKLTIESVDVAS